MLRHLSLLGLLIIGHSFDIKSAINNFQGCWATLMLRSILGIGRSNFYDTASVKLTLLQMQFPVPFVIPRANSTDISKPLASLANQTKPFALFQLAILLTREPYRPARIHRVSPVSYFNPLDSQHNQTSDASSEQQLLHYHRPMCVGSPAKRPR